MHIEKLLFSLFLAALCSVVIKYSSDSFEAASSFLGRHMAPGIKGATINAVGSSMPELLTTAVFLFLYRDIDGFSAGVATAAGSAVFNGLIIPALCIFVVTLCGVKKSTETVRVKYIEVDSRTILRDGVWLVIGEVMLIVFLGDTTLTWVAGLLLLLCYAGYFTHLMYQNRRYGSEIGGGDGAEEDHKSTVPSGKLRALITFDFKTLFYKGKSFTDGRAWVVLWASIVVLSAACILLAKAVIESAQALSIPTYFTAVVLAAAATSVPDTVLSIKDARRGLYDDAISNALGSNIFDITVSLGLPLFIYCLIFGEVSLTAATGSSGAQVQVLRIVLLWVTVAVISLFLIGRKAGLLKATILFAIYIGWITWIADAAFQLKIFGAL